MNDTGYGEVCWGTRRVGGLVVLVVSKRVRRCKNAVADQVNALDVEALCELQFGRHDWAWLCGQRAEAT